MEFYLNIILLVRILLFLFPVLATEVLDTVCFSLPSQFTSEGSTIVRGYTIKDNITENITLGILNDDRGLMNITWADCGTEVFKTLPPDTVFPEESGCRQWPRDSFKFLDIIIPQEQNAAAVFSFEARKDGITSRTAVVMMSSTATIMFTDRTLTVGVGENAVINMTTDQPMADLRWTHNYGDVISKWNGSSAIRIEDVREQDGGVYECYQDENGKDGNHGIMRLIVRACPSPKWNPPSCEDDCPVCYNGGVCDDNTGLCICPSGIIGINCETGYGSKYFGRFGNVNCGAGQEKCKERLFCPPDPVGCNCIDGYGGLDCSEQCTAGWYGAGCQQKCHCDSCDRKTGCAGLTCWDDYTEPNCLKLSSDKACPSGFFGILCNYPCHCKDAADCNRSDGSCDNECHEAWAGSNCSIALPYLSTPPNVTPKASTIMVNVTWAQGREYGTGIITSWILWYKKDGSSEFMSINSVSNVITITELKLHENVTYYSTLSRSVEGVNISGPSSPQGTIQTTCSEPLSPSPPISNSVSENYLDVQWELVPNDLDVVQCADILRYQVGHRNTMTSNRTITNTTYNTEQVMRISDLLECTEYIVDLRVINNEEFASPWSEPNNIRTSPSAPTIVSGNTTIVEMSFTMKWQAPACNNGTDLLYHYRLNYVDSNEEYESGSISEVELTFNNDLEPCTQFNFEVSASFMGVIGPASSIELSTDAELPGVPEIISAESSGGSIEVEWRPPENNQCPISYTVILESSNKEISKVTEDTQVTFTAKDGISLDSNYNVKVAAMTVKGPGSYSASQVVKMDESNDDKQITNNPTPIVVGAVAAVVAVLVVVVILGYLRMKRRQRRKQEGDANPIVNFQHKVDNVTEKANSVCISTNEELPACNEDIGEDPVYENTDIPSRDITLEELHAYIMRKMSSSDDTMEKEFTDLGTKQRHSWDVAKHSANRKKNRYANVVTYDKSRVVLKLDESIPGSDYINASYIDGINIQREYIACQGPNTASVDDMWRMIFQENVGIIVMVTNVIEAKKTKCQKYWPDDGDAQTYANIVVTNKEENDYGCYTIRKFTIQGANAKEVRDVWHYHFTDWPDKSVPPVATPLIDFVYKFKEAKKTLPVNSGPYVVHCSAGAGRTGTVITIDAMLDMADHTGTVNVFNFVRSMRDKRVQMVQTEEQYRFIYEVLLEILFCGKTLLPAAEFLGYFPVLTKSQDQRDSFMNFQLKTLNSLAPNPPVTLTTAGIQVDNLMKNRFKDILPLDTARPYLMTPDKNGNDYINASLCNSYHKQNGYIVTQAPLSDPINTSADFWRLVYDYKVHTIVMLNNQDHMGLGNYFPENEATGQRYGGFDVQLQSTQDSNYLTVRTLTLRKLSAKPVREIHHFAFNAWPSHVTVPQPMEFLQFLTDVERWQAAHLDNPVIIHCLDGFTRSGLFCSLSSIIDKIKEEQMIDVFQTIKILRKSCPRFVNLQEQYKFCYDAIRFYMDGFEAYGNFK